MFTWHDQTPKVMPRMLSDDFQKFYNFNFLYQLAKASININLHSMLYCLSSSILARYILKVWCIKYWRIIICTQMLCGLHLFLKKMYVHFFVNMLFFVKWYFIFLYISTLPVLLFSVLYMHKMNMYKGRYCFNLTFSYTQLLV